jgi:hypothetical protein
MGQAEPERGGGLLGDLLGGNNVSGGGLLGSILGGNRR